MIDIVAVIEKNEAVRQIVDKLIMSNIEIKPEDLETMPDEMFEIIEPFVNKHYNENTVKQVIEKHVNNAKKKGYKSTEIAIADIVNPLIKQAIDDFNKDDFARAKFWSCIFTNIRAETKSEFIEKLSDLEKALDAEEQK